MTDLVKRLRNYARNNLAECESEFNLWNGAANRIENLEALAKADAAEIGSYTDNTGLRGEWKAMQNELDEKDDVITRLHSCIIEKDKALLNIKVLVKEMREIIESM